MTLTHLDLDRIEGLAGRLRARAKSEDEGGSEVAAERAMMGMEAQADLWAERVDLNGLIANLVHVNRLSPSAPDDVREKFIKRQFEQIDALMRQSFLEGYLEGGLSRKEYDAELDSAVASDLTALITRIRELEEALDKLRSYSVDIEAGRINYRPLDHIAVADAALQRKTP